MSAPPSRKLCFSLWEGRRLTPRETDRANFREPVRAILTTFDNFVFAAAPMLRSPKEASARAPQSGRHDQTTHCF
ncbi:MAG: hypothetical protein P4L68_09170 [Methylovirgula sp.]|nr:hypothetical protein [Methylovirgula sp.]